MSWKRRGFAGTVVLLAGTLVGCGDRGDEILFALLQDFTAVYAFTTEEVNQGQQDYIALVNERGGIDGVPIRLMVRDHGNEPQRGIEAYNRARLEGAVLVDALSTPVSRALVNRVLEDEIVMITALHGRADAVDGQTFPFIFPMMATYWSQAALLAQYVDENRDGLAGKRIAFVYIDSPFGREPVPVLRDLAEREDFELRTFAYPPPGNEQSATWSDIRRYDPDFVMIWGAGMGNPVSLSEAVRNNIPMDRILSVVWFAETDVRTAGADRTVGLRRAEVVSPGTDSPVIQDIIETLYDEGRGAGPREHVGSTYYNIGVAMMAVAVEAARLGVARTGHPLTGDGLRLGFEQIRDFDAYGLMPALSFDGEDHQGGGFGRISEWDGERWVPVTDWYAAYQDLVWEHVAHDAAEFQANR